MVDKSELSEKDKEFETIGKAIIELFGLKLDKGRKTSYKTNYGYKNPIGIGKTVNNILTAIKQNNEKTNNTSEKR